MESTLAQLIGQMLMVGWQTSSPRDLVESIKRYNFGNVILFGRNFDSANQLVDTCAVIQEACAACNGAPALISIDQEGGGASRILSGLTPVPGAMALAAAEPKCRSAASSAGRIIGSELKRLGVNFNLAPVADIITNPYNPVISVRAFSDNPSYVAQLASEFALGLQGEGVLACYKHFLGHGDVDVDSRLDLPRVKKSFSELDLCELVPYKASAIADAILVAHILYTDLDDKFPASISKRILKNLLREKLGYNGLIVTDCFEMGGIDRAFSLSEAARYAVNAGADIIPVSHQLTRQLAVRDAILGGAKEGNISIDTLLAANARIAAAKVRYTRSPTEAVDYSRNARTAEKISDSSIAVLSGQLFEIDAKTVVIGVQGVGAVGVIGTVDPQEKESPHAEKLDVAKRIGTEFRIPYRTIDNKNFNVGELVAFAKAGKVILCVSDSHLTLVQKVLYSALSQAHCAIVLVSLRTPYDVLGQDPPVCHIATWGYTEQAVGSLLKVLRGGAAYGVSPVRLERKSTAVQADESRNYIVDNIVRYIHDNFAKHLSLDSVAEEFYISGGHLCKLIKRKLGKNFIDVVNEVRIAEAKKLLTTTSIRIYEVAALCGFADINYFTKTFKKYTLVTPTSYRNS